MPMTPVNARSGQVPSTPARSLAAAAVLLSPLSNAFAVSGDATAPSQPSTKSTNAEGRYNWDNDAAEPGLQTSLSVLLSWLTDANNYEKYMGANGKNPTKCAREIQSLVEEAGCRGKRKAWAIIEKVIRTLKSQFIAAEKWLDETGKGRLEEAQDQGEVRYGAVKTAVMAKVYQICPNYDALCSVFKDRAGVNPAFSHSTGDASDPAAAAVQRLAAGAQSQATVDQTGSSPEVFYPGWENSQDGEDRQEEGLDEEPTAGPPSQPSLTQSAPFLGDGTSGSTTGSLPRGLLQTSNASPGSSQGTGLVGRAKRAAAKAKGSKRMSAIEKGINERGNKRLKLERKVKQKELAGQAFQHITTRAQFLQEHGQTSSAAFKQATKEYKTHMKTFELDLEGESSHEEDDNQTSDDDEETGDLGQV
ncbi:hypothetical protein OC861_006289 [Tilletia horrida]|nr:hypothetical protein OC861_006289 [Tilletia horrida]